MKSKLLNDISELLENNIISQEVATNISAYYKSKEDSQPNRLFTVFGVLGATLVGLGIILIIAHNWDNLSRSIKTVFAFIPLVIAQLVSGYSIYKEKSQVWKELPPKGKHVLLELPLKDLLPQATAKGQLARPQWGWDWRARPAPPMSPITQPRSHQLIPKATFWVQARIGKEVVVSNKVSLAVKISR